MRETRGSFGVAVTQYAMRHHLGYRAWRNAIACMLWLASCGCNEGSATTDTPTAIRAAHQRAAGMYRTLTLIRDNAANAPSAQPCARDATWRPIGITWNQLLYRTNAPTSLVRTPAEIEAKQFTHFTFERMLTIDEQPRYPNGEMAKDIDAASAAVHAATHIAVLRPTVTQLPSRVGTSFSPGRVEGEVMFFNAATGQYVCASAFTATNQNSVGYQAASAGGYQAASGNERRADYALTEDLKRQIEAAGRAILTGTKAP